MGNDPGLVRSPLTSAEGVIPTPVSQVLMAVRERLRALQRFNPNHDETGKFSSGDGGGDEGGVATDDSPSTPEEYAQQFDAQDYDNRFPLEQAFEAFDKYANRRSDEPVNAGLRTSGVESLSEQHQETVRALDEAISATPPLAADLVVYRGLALDNMGWGVDPVVGFSFHDNAFVSTTHSRATAEFFAKTSNRAVIELHVPPGSRVLDTSRMAENPSGEQEVLLPRGAQFVLTGVDRTPSGEWRLTATFSGPGQSRGGKMVRAVPAKMHRFVDWDASTVEIDSDVRFNQNHDEKGQFSSGDGAAASSSGPLDLPALGLAASAKDSAPLKAVKGEMLRVWETSPLRAPLTAFGLKVYAGTFPKDKHPGEKQGEYNANKRTVTALATLSPQNVGPIMQHEMGHAFDHSLGNPASTDKKAMMWSSGPEFTAAYASDGNTLFKMSMPAMTGHPEGDAGHAFEYQAMMDRLTKPNVRLAEVFADAVAAAHGGMIRMKFPADFFERAHPRIMALVRQKISQARG